MAVPIDAFPVNEDENAIAEVFRQLMQDHIKLRLEILREEIENYTQEKFEVFKISTFEKGI